MRAFDISGVGLALVLVPLYCWLLGRFAGRRDWRIGAVLALGLVIVMLAQVGILAGQCVIEAQTSAVGKDFLFLLQRRGAEALANPEFPVFLFVLGTFVTMLGWSATPVKKAAETVVA
jgi:hypothetical protein